MMKKILFISVLLVFIVFAIVFLFCFFCQDSFSEILIDQQITVQDIKSPVFRDFLKKIGVTKWRVIISFAHPDRPYYSVFLTGTTDASFNRSRMPFSGFRKPLSLRPRVRSLQGRA